MKKPIILSIAAVSVFNFSSAQVNFSIAGGGLNYQGEMGSSVSNYYSNMSFDAKSIKPVFQGSLGYYVNSVTQISIEAGVAQFQGNDMNSAKASIRNRNYSVSGNLMDFGLNVRRHLYRESKVYAIFGLKGVVSKSTLMKASSQYITQDFKNVSVSLPLGAGLELASIGGGMLKFEWITNTVLNDKLDGVNYSYSKFDDVYSTALLVYSLPLSKSGYRNQVQYRESRRSYRSFGMKHGQCPQF